MDFFTDTLDHVTRESVISDMREFLCRRHGWRNDRLAAISFDARQQVFIGSDYAGRMDDDMLVADRDRDHVVRVNVFELAA